MNQIFQWWRDHSAAVLATALVVSKAGVLGKSASAILAALAVAFGASI